MDKKMKRSSILTYVPIHRRPDMPNQPQQPQSQQQQQQQQQQRLSYDGYGKRHSYGQHENGLRLSADFSNGSKSTLLHQQQQRNWRNSINNKGHNSSSGSVDDEDYSEDNSFPPTPSMHRYSNSVFLDSLAHHDDHLQSNGNSHRQSTGPEDWDELLRQYDRSDDDPATLARKNKRASRVMDPFHEPPAQVPIVDEPTVILDCSEFPKSFKTHHLHDIFREYENLRGGYRIKWMDDTRALIIFEHPATAKKAYIDNVAHAYAKIRPYEGPTDFLTSPPSQSNRRSVNLDSKRHSGVAPKPLK
jgi:hypothetical protein